MSNTFNLGNGNWATKKEAVLAYNSENNNFKPLPFSFDRGSIATVVNKDGLIETVGVDEPRIDFLNNTKGHLLLEPSRSNLAPYSEDFSQSVWNKTNSTVSLNQGISPDGKNNATLYTSTTSSDRLQTNFIIPTTIKTFSIWVKSYNNNSVTGRVTFAGLNNVNFTTTNEWQLITTTRDVSGDNFPPSIRLDEADVSILVWGAQLEQGSYATSYIPTSGSAETRSADVCNNAGNSNVFNDSEGVLYAEIAALADDGTSRRISISAGNTNNNNLVSLIYGTSNKISPSIYSGGGFQMGGDFTLSDQTDTIKVALKYSLNDAALWVNGVEVLTDNIVTPPVGLDQIKFEYGNGSNDFYGKCKDLRVYDTALSDSELETLTTL